MSGQRDWSWETIKRGFGIDEIIIRKGFTKKIQQNARRRVKIDLNTFEL